MSASSRYRLAYGDQIIAIPAQGTFTIGRGDGCDLRLDDPLVSRRHVVLLAFPDRLLLRDVGRHGTVVNGKKVDREVELQPGDRVAVGTQRFEVRKVNRLLSDRPTAELSVGAVQAEMKAARKGARIVVIDDDAAECESTRKILAAEGYEVVAVTTPITARATVESLQPQLVLLEVDMPAVSGERIAATLKANASAVGSKLIFYADQDPASLARVVERAGADGFIAKGTAPTELIRKVRAFVGGAA